MNRKNSILPVIVILLVTLAAGCGHTQTPAPAVPVPESIPAAGESDILTRPVEIICPWAPGGSSDVNAKTIGQVVSEMIGQPVTVSNITGGGGGVGFTAQYNAPPDGYTLGIITAELNTLPPQNKLPFTFEKLHLILRMNTLPACIAVPDDSPFHTLGDLILYAKAHPGQLKNGNVGTGSIWHICAAKLEAAADIRLNHRAYDGAATAVQSLLTGALDMVVLETSVCQPFVDSGKLRILAVMAEERLTSFPQYSTCRELGYDIVAGSYQGIVCPTGVPDAIKREWERVFTDAFYSESYQKFCEKYGLEKSFLSSADFYTFLEEDMEKVSEVIRTLDLSS